MTINQEKTGILQAIRKTHRRTAIHPGRKNSLPQGKHLQRGLKIRKIPAKASPLRRRKTTRNRAAIRSAVRTTGKAGTRPAARMTGKAGIRSTQRAGTESRMRSPALSRIPLRMRRNLRFPKMTWMRQKSLRRSL